MTDSEAQLAKFAQGFDACVSLLLSPFSPPSLNQDIEESNEHLPDAVVQKALKKLNDKVTETLKETRSQATRRTFIAEMLSIAASKGSSRSVDEATRQRLAGLSERLEQQRRDLAVAQARNRTLTDLVSEVQRIDVATLPGSFLTQRSPIVAALEELNGAAAAVSGKLRAHGAAVQQARKRAHTSDKPADPLSLLLSAAAGPAESQTQG